MSTVIISHSDCDCESDCGRRLNWIRLDPERLSLEERQRVLVVQLHPEQRPQDATRALFNMRVIVCVSFDGVRVCQWFYPYILFILIHFEFVFCVRCISYWMSKFTKGSIKYLSIYLICTQLCHFQPVEASSGGKRTVHLHSSSAVTLYSGCDFKTKQIKWCKSILKYK